MKILNFNVIPKIIFKALLPNEIATVHQEYNERGNQPTSAAEKMLAAQREREKARVIEDTRLEACDTHRAQRRSAAKIFILRVVENFWPMRQQPGG